MLRKLAGIFLGMVGVSLGGVAGCDRSQARAGFTMPPPMVTTTGVITADVPVYLDEIGKTTAYEYVTIEPQASGKISGRFFEDGAELKAGQKLFEIDPGWFVAAVDAANAQLQQSQAQLAIAKTNLQRMTSLLPSKAVSQQDFDNSKNAVAVAEAGVKTGEALVETATLELQYCTISSPINGRAGQRLVDVGNIVNSNTTPLVVIQRMDPIYADFTIPENDLDRVRLNMKRGTLKVQVNMPDDPGHPAEGNLVFLDNAVQDGTGTIKLRAEVANAERRLWPGQFVNVRLILATIKDALMIPNEAIQIGQQGPFVFVVKADHTAEQRPVTPGQRQGMNVVIDKGLAAGETVIETGQLMVVPGGPVNVLQGPGAAPVATASTTEPSATAPSTAGAATTVPATATPTTTGPSTEPSAVMGGAKS